jgi:hypothetical protein
MSALRSMLAMAVLAPALSSVCFAQDAKKAGSGLDDYTVDVTAGAISASGLVGLTGSAITQVETAQDIVAALQPAATSGAKVGFGLAITPARTALTPMPASLYRGSDDGGNWSNWYWRVLGATTLSYAQTSTDISSTTYRKQAVSLDTSYYLKRSEDPILMGQDAFGKCDERQKLDRKAAQAGRDENLAKRLKAAAQLVINDPKASEDAKLKAEQQLNSAEDTIAKAEDIKKSSVPDTEAANKKCIDDKLATSKWNASRLSLSFGTGWIQPEDSSMGKESLGRSATLNGLFEAGSQGAVNLSLRRTTHEVDLTTLTTTPAFKSSNLAALRYTYGTKDDNGAIKVLGEVSNAKASEVTQSNSVFKYAFGVDARLAKGLWLEFRLGRNRTIDGTSNQTTGLLTLTFAPTAGLFSK